MFGPGVVLLLVGGLGRAKRQGRGKWQDEMGIVMKVMTRAPLRKLADCHSS